MDGFFVNAFSKRSQPLRAIVDRNLINLRKLPSKDLLPQYEDEDSRERKRGNEYEQRKKRRGLRRRVSRIERIKDSNRLEIAKSHKNSNVVFRIQIVDCVLRTNKHMRRNSASTPRVFVRCVLAGNTLRTKETRPVRDLVPTWKDEYFLVRRWMAPPRAVVQVLLMEEKDNGKVQELGRVLIFFFQIQRL